jgi:hypothetical protein
LSRTDLGAATTSWKGRPWLLGSLVTDDRLRSLVVDLHVTAGIATIACAVR